MASHLTRQDEQRSRENQKRPLLPRLYVNEIQDKILTRTNTCDRRTSRDYILFVLEQSFVCLEFYRGDVIEGGNPTIRRTAERCKSIVVRQTVREMPEFS